MQGQPVGFFFSEIYLDESNLDSCAALVSELSQETSDEAIQFSILMNIRLTLANENKTLEELNVEQLLTLSDVANSNTLTAGIAEVILEFAKGDTFEHPIFPLPSGPEMRIAKQKEEKLLDINPSNLFVRISPNPSSKEFSVKYSVEENSSGMELEMFDLLGKRIYSVTLSETSGTKTIPVTTIENGIYFLSLANNGKKILNQKVAIIH